MKLKSYKELLKLSKDAVKEVLAPLRANKAKSKALLEIAKLEEAIATKEQAVDEFVTKDDIDFDKVISLMDEIGLLERKREQFKKIIADLFPESEQV